MMTRAEAEEKARDAWRRIAGEWDGSAKGYEDADIEVECVIDALTTHGGDVVVLVVGSEEAKRAALALEDGSAQAWAWPWKDELAQLAKRLRGGA